MDPASARDDASAWERANFGRLVWLFPAIYVPHVLEESFGFPSWVDGVLRGRFSSVFFWLANAWFMLVLLVLARRVSRVRAPASVVLFFTWVSGQFFWDALFHVFTENHFSTYSPGYFTAVFLYVPTYCYFAYLALRERFLSPRNWFVAFIFGGLLLMLVIWGGLYKFGPIPWSIWG